MPKPDLQLLCQPAGSGKTYHCLQVFRQALLNQGPGFARRAFFILPSREHVNRINDLLLRDSSSSASPLKGLINPPVLTINEFLNRLAGISTAGTPGGILRNFLIKSILSENTFEYYENAKSHRGLTELAADFIAEAKAAGASPGELDRMAELAAEESPLFAKKMRDLALIFKMYDERIRGLGLEDPEDLLKKFSALAGGAARFDKLDLVILDGFFHFSPMQQEFIRALTRIAKRVIVTLTLDKSPARSHAFAFPDATRRALLAMGFQEAGRQDAPNRRAKNAALAALEKGLFSRQPQSAEAAARPDPQEAVRIFEATGVSGEIEMIAREIKRLYREEGYHFSDVCLIFRSIGSYEEVVRAVFDSFRVPVEIHERKKLKHNAFIRAVVRWVRVLKDGWKREDLFALLQSNYYGFDQQAVHSLEQKSLEAGVLEGAEAWEGLCGRIEGVEKKILEELLAARREMLPAKKPQEYKNLFLRWVARHDMLRRLARSGAGPESANPDATREDFQAYRVFENILDEVTLHRGGEAGETPLADYLDHLLAAAELSLFSAPVHEKNRVQVYDAVLALQKEYKVIFLAGLLEKNFPQRILEDALLKDEERRFLNRRGARFEERLARVSGERFFFYMAVSRAREKLYLTYPRFDLEGKEALPSFYVEEVGRCLGAQNIPVRRKDINQVVPLLEEVSEPGDLFMILTQALFDKNAGPQPATRFYAELYNGCVAAAGDYLSVLKEAAKDEENAEIRDPRILTWFRDQDGPLSATRLEIFATCPFRYFAEHVLGLKEKAEGIDSRELGTLLHRVLQELYEEMPRAADGRLLSAGKEETARRARQKLEELFDTARFPGAKKTDRDLLRARLAEVLTEWAEQEHKKEEGRKTIPAYFEKKFGFQEAGSLDYLRLETVSGQEVLIRGAIDRIDVEPETGAALVIDYKSGGYKADKLMEHLGKGIELQIPIYLMAAEKLLGLKPAGGELYPVMKPSKRRGVYDGPAVAKIAEISSQSAGLLEGPEFRRLLDTLKKQIPEYAARLRQGDIRVRSKACGKCSYNHLCRFETWKLIYSEEKSVWEKPAT